MVTNITNTKMLLFIQCQDDNGNYGSFIRDSKTKKQFGNTYIDLYNFYKGHEAKFCKAHGIEIIIPQKVLLKWNHTKK